MSDDFCPRQIAFTLPGNPGVLVTATEVDGTIVFKVDVLDTTTSTGDLRALFFDINEVKLGGMTVTGGDGLITESRVQANKVLDLGDGATLAGKVKQPFDVGIEFGTPGGKKDDINFEVTFTLSNTAGDLTLDDIAFQRFGAKLDSVGGPGGVRNGATKLLTTAPAAPDAVDDVIQMWEDGAADTSSPSKSPTDVILYVLDNDTDADIGQVLTITSIHEQPAFGTVTIAADNRSLIYTPQLDYSGTVTFEYCVSDGNGGQDHALVTLNIEAVADDPLITWEVAQGANINEILLTVTATENDADGSETIDDIVVSNAGTLPLGASITPTSSVNNADGSHTQVFTVTTDAGQDFLFDVDFTATSRETSNNDTESATETQTIEIDYNENFSTLTYEVTDQSIWSTGDAFVFDYDEFLGIDESFNESGGSDIVGTTYDIGASIKAGFDVLVHFEAGDIDASIPVDVTVNTTYNKTTDAIYIDPLLSLGTGGFFDTTGPEGLFKLDFIFEVAAHAFAELLFVDLIDLSFDESLSENIFDIDSSDPAQVYTILGGLVDIGFEWPHISVTNDPGLLSGSGETNNFLFATLDVDQLANFLLGGALSFIDTDPNDPGNFELLDFDITGGLNFIQSFAIALASTSATLVLEDLTEVAFSFGTPLTITDASSHDLNNDGTIEFTFKIDPNVTLNNTTELAGNLSAHLTIPKNFDYTIVDATYPIVDGPLVTVFDETFALTGVGSQDYLIYV